MRREMDGDARRKVSKKAGKRGSKGSGDPDIG
jgi:hypothetical protein